VFLEWLLVRLLFTKRLYCQQAITIMTTISSQHHQRKIDRRPRAYRIAGELVNGTTPTASLFLNLTGGKPLLLEGDEDE
jgi:hypothetical protein